MQSCAVSKFNWAFGALVLLFGQGFASQDRQPERIPNPSSPGTAALFCQAQAAMGGEKAIDAARSVSLTLRLKRFISYIAVVSPRETREKEKVLTGRITIDIQFPDKFRKKVSAATLMGNKLSYVEVVNGDAAWRDPPSQARPSGPDPRQVDINDFGRSIAYQQQGARQQFAFYALSLFARVLPGSSVHFGPGIQDDNSSDAFDKLTVYGLTDPPTQLLLDRSSHLPLSFESTIVEGFGPRVIVEGSSMWQGDFELMVAKAQELRKKLARPARRASLKIQFLDRHPVSGILVPHRIMAFIDEKPREELVITGIKIDRQIGSSRFEKESRPSR
jgi:hypothetical protein